MGLLAMGCVPFLKLLDKTEGFGCGFIMFGCFSQFLSLFLLISMFILGFKFLQIKAPSSSVHYSCDGREKSNGFCLKGDFVNGFDQKKTICSTGILSKDDFFVGFDQERMNCSAGFHSKRGFLKGFDQINKKCSAGFCSETDFAEGFDMKYKSCSNEFSLKSDCVDGSDQKKSITCKPRNKNFMDDPETNITEKDNLAKNKDQGSANKDQIFDVMILRKMVKEERKRADALYIELEKERVAAASAAEEAMAMLLRLQSEKCAVEMEAKQYKRIAEQKQEYDREVTQGLQWMVMRQEEDRKVLEDRLRFCVLKLKMYMDDDDENDYLLEGLFDTPGVVDQMENGDVVVTPEVDPSEF